MTASGVLYVVASVVFALTVLGVVRPDLGLLSVALAAVVLGGTVWLLGVFHAPFP